MNVSSDLEGILRVMRSIDSRLRDGEDLRALLDEYGIEQETWPHLVNRFCSPNQDAQVLRGSHLPNAVAPIFCEPPHGSAKQVGSGTLLRVAGEVYLLTAAHVLDLQQVGPLLIPGEESLIAANGRTSKYLPPGDFDREKDTFDIGYVRLSTDAVEQLHSSFTILELKDIFRGNSSQSVPFATFVGWPLTKVTRRGQVHSGEITTYTGHTWTADVIERLGYSFDTHFCIRMRLKRTYSSLFGRKTIAPKPDGVSGGAVLAWPQTIESRKRIENLRLAGIAHTFDPVTNCLIGTHVKFFIWAILHNRPEARDQVGEELSSLTGESDD